MSKHITENILLSFLIPYNVNEKGQAKKRHSLCKKIRGVNFQYILTIK